MTTLSPSTFSRQPHGGALSCPPPVTAAVCPSALWQQRSQAFSTPSPG